jgi:stage II sporulation SpoAA-like protein
VLEVLEGFPDDVAAFAFRGRVTRHDYDTVLMPGFEDLPVRHKKVRIYCEIAPDLTNFGLDAIWADSQFGMGHYFGWDRCAIVSDVEWVKPAAKFSELFGFLWPGKYRTFPGAEAKLARQWIAEPNGKCGSG